jgi:hypothetical protein
MKIIPFSGMFLVIHHTILWHDLSHSFSRPSNNQPDGYSYIYFQERVNVI